MALTQIRQDTPGKAYYLRKRSQGKSHKEAMRCLERRLSDVVYRQLRHDANRLEAVPGGHSGAALSSSAASSNPATDASDKSLPRPTTSHPTTDGNRSLDTERRRLRPNPFTPPVDTTSRSFSKFSAPVPRTLLAFISQTTAAPVSRRGGTVGSDNRATVTPPARVGSYAAVVISR